jgi:hypothetical protein
MPSAAVLKVKQAYNDKICNLLENHDRAFLVHADNVGSRQFMDIRAVRLRFSGRDTRISPLQKTKRKSFARVCLPNLHR